MVAVNLRVLPTTTDYMPLLAAQPSVAVLIPARNEAANIEACLRSLLAQDYPNLQIWLYDDQSTDDTAAIARGVASTTEQPTIHVVEGTSPPPPGWLGKANALHNLYAAVRAELDPDYVLFTDADVTFEPTAVSQAVATAIAWRAGLLSIFPRQIVLTLAERLAVPIALHWTVYNFLPLPVAFNTKIPAFAAANGQFMLFTREAYDSCGGHAAVRDNILEDVSLARAVKQAGHRAILADGGSTIYTRMYKGAGEVWSGYSKNAYAFFGYNPLLLIVGVVVLMALYVFPPHPGAACVHSRKLDVGRTLRGPVPDSSANAPVAGHKIFLSPSQCLPPPCGDPLLHRNTAKFATLAFDQTGQLERADARLKEPVRR